MRRLTAMLLVGGMGLGLCLLVGPSGLAATIHVPADRPTIQAGINAAVDGDTVLVAPGIYGEHIDFFGKRIVVKSTKGADSTVITRVVDGLALVSFLNSEDSTAVLEGFTLTGLINSPACVYCNGTSPRVTDNIIRGNSGVGACYVATTTLVPLSRAISYTATRRRVSSTLTMAACRWLTM